MTDEDVGTVVGNWVSHAEVKVMTAKLVPTSTTAGHASSSSGGGEVVYDEAGRFLVGRTRRVIRACGRGCARLRTRATRCGGMRSRAGRLGHWRSGSSCDSGSGSGSSSS